MTVKIAIDGFGRIGRGVLRALIEGNSRDIEVVAINDLAPVQTIEDVGRGGLDCWTRRLER